MQQNEIRALIKLYSLISFYSGMSEYDLYDIFQEIIPFILIFLFFIETMHEIFQLSISILNVEQINMGRMKVKVQKKVDNIKDIII